MTAPAIGETIDVHWNGRLHLQLKVYRVDDEPSYPGWVTLHGHVEHKGGPLNGSWWEQRTLFVNLQGDGSVRMLGTDERLTSRSA